MYDWSLNYVAYSHVDFHRSSIKTLLSLIHSALGPNGCVNVAFNDQSILMGDKLNINLYGLFEKNDCSILVRDNDRREFGAYKELCHLNSLKSFERNAIHIFVNSTWDRHRDASNKVISEIKMSLRSSLSHDSPLFMGPWSTFGAPFIINDVVIHSWVCTYMFVYNQNALNMGCFELTPENVINSYFGDGSSEMNYFSNSLHPLLKQRWEAWFFGLHQNLPKWYGAKNLKDFEPKFLKRKIISCIDEHYLTRSAIAKNIPIFPLLKRFTGS